MKIIKNKSFDEFIKKYGHSYRNGKVIKITEKQNQEFKENYGHYFYANKKYQLDKISLLNKKRKYYYIDNIYYQCPKVSKNGFITLVCSAALIITGGSIGGYYLYKSFNTTSTNIKSQEVKEYTEIISENPPLIGESYKCEIKINEKGTAEGDNQKFMPATFKTVSTGGVVLPEWHSSVTVTPSVASTFYSDKVNSVSNITEPENYYTYSLDESRTKGNLFIKKILGPVVIDFDLSNIKSIELTNKPHKLIYYVGQKFEANGLSILATDVHGNTKQILDNDPDIKLSINNGYEFTTSDVGSKKVTAIYKEASTSFDIEIIKDSITEIRVDSSKCKVNYLVDEAISVDGIKVEAQFQSAPGVWSEIKGYSVSPSIGSSFNETGTKQITISCPGVEEKSFDVNVTEPTEMRIASLPNKVTYKVGDEFTLAGLQLSISRQLDGQRGLMDNRDKKYEISSDSDIQEGYIFKQDDIGHLKKIIIKHSSKTGLSFTNTFYVAVPLDCTLRGTNDFVTQFSKAGTTYNAFKLNDPGLYDFSGTRYGGSSQDIMIVGSAGVMFDAVGKTRTSEGYIVDWFAGLNIMLCDLTFKRTDTYTSITGMLGYTKAIFSNVTFNETYWYWGGPNASQHVYNAFFNCYFNTRLEDTYNDYALYNYSGSDLEFNKCVFNANTRHIKMYTGIEYGLSFLTFNDCQFKSNHTPKVGDNHLMNIKDVNDGYDLAPAIVSINNCEKVKEDGKYYTDQFDWTYIQSSEPSKPVTGTKVFVNGEKTFPA